MNIEWTFNGGTIGTILFVAGGFYFVTRLVLKQLTEDVVDIKGDLKMLNKVVTELAVQDKRMDNQGEHIASHSTQLALLEKRVYEITHGDGFVQRGMEGEWPKR